MSGLSFNLVLRVIALPACGGITLELAIKLPKVLQNGHFFSPDFGGFFIIGFFLSCVIGWPLLGLIQWKFSGYPFRYVVGGSLCGSLLWLLLNGPVFPGKWSEWLDLNYWSSVYGLRSLLLFTGIGLIAGLLYTGIVILIEKFAPEK